MLRLFKRLLCAHAYIEVEDNFKYYFGSDYVGKVCTKCGKRIY